MKFYLFNEKTCIRLKLFGEDLRNILVGNGWKEAEREDAEYLFINSCSFISSKEEEVISIIRRIVEQKKKNQKICIFGCLPSTNPKRIKEISPNITLFKRDLEEIINFFKLKRKTTPISHTTNKSLSKSSILIDWANKIFIKDKTITYRLNKNKVFHLKISEGCTGKCTYCSEKFTTRLKSRKISEILQEFRKGLKKYNIFSLNADDTSSFGQDNNENILSLLNQIIKNNNEFSLAITEFNPRGMNKDIINILSSEKIIFITLPIQSGSQRILDKMKRQYEIRDIISKLIELKKLNPKIKINTHLIVGFPGETKKDFQETLNIIDKNIFDRIKVFKYNDRPGTEASMMPNKISEREKSIREKRLRTKILFNCIKNKQLSNLLLNFSNYL